MFSFNRKTRRTSKATARPVTRPAAKVVSRAVTHQRWIPVSELEIGMQVIELSVPWEDTGFMFQGFTIDSVALLKQVAKSCDQVLVRSEKVANISSNASHRLCSATR